MSLITLFGLGFLLKTLNKASNYFHQIYVILKLIIEVIFSNLKLRDRSFFVAMVII